MVYFGGVPGRIRYDNLKPAVFRVLKGRDRTESERFTALRSHYGFDSFFRRPGIVRTRRAAWKVSLAASTVASLGELNEVIAEDGAAGTAGQGVRLRPVTAGAGRQ